MALCIAVSGLALKTASSATFHCKPCKHQHKSKVPTVNHINTNAKAVPTFGKYHVEFLAFVVYLNMISTSKIIR